MFGSSQSECIKSMVRNLNQNYENAQIFIVNQRGCGCPIINSELYTNEYLYHEDVEETIKFIKSGNQTSKIILIGTSLGSMKTLMFITHSQYSKYIDFVICNFTPTHPNCPLSFSKIKAFNMGLGIRKFLKHNIEYTKIQFPELADHIDRIDMLQFDSYIGQHKYNLDLEQFYQLIFPNKYYNMIKVPTLFIDIINDETCMSFDCDEYIKQNKLLSHYQINYGNHLAIIDQNNKDVISMLIIYATNKFLNNQQ